MSEDQAEREHISPIREAELGEWFSPFVGYENIPYENQEYVDEFKRDYHSKEIPFQIKSVGKFTTSVESLGSFVLEPQNKALVVLPFGEKIIEETGLPEYEGKIESRLILVAVVCIEEKYVGREPPYKVEMRVPSGQIFKDYFEKPRLLIDQPLTGFWWLPEGSEEGISVWIPEVENILEKIQMRIVPITESQRLP